jgi:hypothetical protein
MKKYLISCLMLASMQVTYSYACSTPPLPSVQEAFQKSSDVYLAIAISVKNSSQKSSQKIIEVDQEVVFKVLEVWKGSKKENDTIVFNTVVSRGGCGVSATNNPPWFEDELPDPKTGKITYVKMSGIWLIYENGNKQHSLTRSGRTAPFEHGGVNDMKELYELSSVGVKDKP